MPDVDKVVEEEVVEQNQENQELADPAGEIEGLETEETEGVVEETVETETEYDPERFDEDGVPWKNRAKEYRKKYYKTLEDKDPKQTAKVEPDKADPRLQELRTDMISDSDWEEIEDKRGLSRHAIVELHNANVKASKLEARLNARDASETVKGVLAGVDKEYRASVEQYIDEQGIDKSNPDKVRRAADLIVLAEKGKRTPGQMAEVEKRTKKRLEEQRKVVLSQPGDTAPKATDTNKVKLTEEQKIAAEKGGLTEEEYAKYL